MRRKKYRSKLEETTAKLLNDNGIEFTYEDAKIQFEFPVRGGKCTSCGATGRHVVRKRTYLPDFVVEPKIVVESKGILDASQRTKFLAIKKSNPEWTITFVFGADNKLTRKSKQRYSDWCVQHGFDFGIKALPPSIKKRKR